MACVRTSAEANDDHEAAATQLRARRSNAQILSGTRRARTSRWRSASLGVIAAGKPPVDYSRFPEAAPRGTHVHRCMEALATGSAMPDPVSPEGIDCSEWFRVIAGAADVGRLNVLATEYTMTKRRWSLGGQLDLLVRERRQPHDSST